MKKEKSKLCIEKVFSDIHTDNTPQTFQYMPKLSLELIENKRKIKPSVVNKPYIPSTYVRQHRTSPQELDEYFNKLYSTYYSPKQNDIPDIGHDELTQVSEPWGDSKDTGVSNLPELPDDMVLDVDQLDDILPQERPPPHEDVRQERPPPHEDVRQERPPPQEDVRQERPPPQEDVQQRKDAQRSTPWDAFEAVKQFASEPAPHYPVDISRLSNDDDLEQKHRIMHKFDILKMGNKDHTFPSCSIHMDLKTLKKIYDSEVLKLHIHNSLQSNRKYLIGGFIVTEYVFGYYCGFDMKGFTQQQIVSMSSYDRLLIELGEKTYAEEDSNLPVEVRLIGLVVVNAALFLFSKLIMKNTGTNALNFLSSFNTTAQHTTGEKKHMRGPQ